MTISTKTDQKPSIDQWPGQRDRNNSHDQRFYVDFVLILPQFFLVVSVKPYSSHFIVAHSPLLKACAHVQYNTTTSNFPYSTLIISSTHPTYSRLVVLMFLSLLLEQQDCKNVAATPLSQVDKSLQLHVLLYDCGTHTSTCTLLHLLRVALVHGIMFIVL